MRLLLKSFGPGVITGAADDDPSGIATYSVAGAQLGTKPLWTALLTWPLMAAVQMMCARIGKVTGQGLAANFKQRFPSWLLRVVVVALLAANTINIAADLAGMADAAEMLSGINSHWFVVLFALLISWATIRLQYHQIANVLKWLVLVLFAYPITAFVVGTDWSEVVRATLVPRNGQRWLQFLAQRSVRTCFSGKRVRRLKRKRRQGRVRSLNGEEQRSKNLN
jgi:NRAMP (natural resistance-associated macrophage protein)-like metal ion transporter